LLVKQVNRLKKPEPTEPTTKDCPYCLSEIPIKATRCPHCTSELDAA
jgi:large conductance mechanosensitive channel